MRKLAVAIMILALVLCCICPASFAVKGKMLTPKATEAPADEWKLPDNEAEISNKSSNITTPSSSRSDIYSSYITLSNGMNTLLQYYVDKIEAGEDFPELWYRAFRADLDIAIITRRAAVYEDAIARGYLSLEGEGLQLEEYRAILKLCDSATDTFATIDQRYAENTLTYKEVLDYTVQLVNLWIESAEVIN